MVNVYGTPPPNPFADPTPPPTREAADLGNTVGQQNREDHGLGGTLYGQPLNQLAYTVEMQNQNRAAQQAQDAYYANQQSQRDANRAAIQERVRNGQVAIKYSGWNDDLANPTPEPGSIAADPQNAYNYTREAARKGDWINPFVYDKAIAEGYVPTGTERIAARNDAGGGRVSADLYNPIRDAVPWARTYEDIPVAISTVPIRKQENIPLHISASEAARYPTLTLFAPYGNEAQTEVPNAKVGYTDSGKYGAYQQNRYGMWELASSGSSGTLQSGMVTAERPETALVYTQESGGSKFSSFADVPNALKILANPDDYSHLGAERYGGYVSPLLQGDAGRLRPTDQLSTYENPYNLAGLVNPYTVNRSKSEQMAMGEIPLGNVIGSSTPGLFRVDSEGSISPASLPARMRDAFGFATTPTYDMSMVKKPFLSTSTSAPATINPAAQNLNEFLLPEDYIGLHPESYTPNTSRMESTLESVPQLFGSGIDITTGFLSGGKFTPFATQNKNTGLGAPRNQADVDYLDTARNDFTNYMGTSNLGGKKAYLESKGKDLFTLQSGFESENSSLTKEGNDLKTIIAYNTNLGGQWVGSEELYYNTSAKAKFLQLRASDYNARLDKAMPDFNLFSAQSGEYNKEVGIADMLYSRIGEAEQRGYKSGALTFQNMGGQLKLAPNPANQRPYGAWSDVGAMASSWILGFQGRTAEDYEAEAARRENLASSGTYTGFAARAFAADNMLFAAKKEIALNPGGVISSGMSGAQLAVVGAGIAGIEAAFPAASFIQAGSKASTFLKYAAPVAKAAVPTGLAAMFLWSASEGGTASPGKFEMNIGSGMTHLAAMTYGGVMVPSIIEASNMRAGVAVGNGRFVGVMGDIRSQEVVGIAASKDLGLGFYRAPQGGAFDTAVLWNRMAAPTRNPTYTSSPSFGGGFLPGGSSSGGRGGGGGGWTPPDPFSPSPSSGSGMRLLPSSDTGMKLLPSFGDISKPSPGRTKGSPLIPTGGVSVAPLWTDYNVGSGIGSYTELFHPNRPGVLNWAGMQFSTAGTVRGNLNPSQMLELSRNGFVDFNGVWSRPQVYLPTTSRGGSKTSPAFVRESIGLPTVARKKRWLNYDGQMVDDEAPTMSGAELRLFEKIQKMKRFEEGYRPTPAEAEAFMQEKYPESWKRKEFKNKVHQMPTRFGKKGNGGTSSPDYIFKLEMEHETPPKLKQKPYKEYQHASDKLRTYTLNDLLHNGRPGFVATRAEQAIVIRQYDLTHDEIRKAKQHKWSLNDLLRYREGEKQMKEYDMSLALMSQDLLRKQLAKRPKTWTVMVPGHQQQYPGLYGNQQMIGDNLIQRLKPKYKPDQLSENRGGTLVFGEPPRGMQKPSSRDRQKVGFYNREEFALSNEPISKKDLKLNQKQKQMSFVDQRFERMSLQNTDVFNIPDRVQQTYVEPARYTPQFGLPGLPIIPPFGMPWGGGSSSQDGGGRGHGKYPWREVIPLNWQLW